MIKSEKLSFVIPCYGSEMTIEAVIDEIHEVMAQKPEHDYEIVCINDCSPDGVLEILKKRVINDKKLIIVDLTQNTGRTNAILAGYSIVSGSYVVTLDDDGQCPLDKLWVLFAAVSAGGDITYARYPKKKHSTYKRLTSYINDFMAQKLIKKPKGLQMSNFNIMKRFIINELKQYQNAFPYLGGYILNTTNNIINVEMEERDRAAGRSTHNFRKSFALWMNGFVAYSIVPLRISSLLGTVTAIAGLVYGLKIIIQRLFFIPNMAVGYPSIMAAILFIGGMIMLMLGMLGEYVGRIYINQNRLPQYVIRDIIKSEKQDGS